MDTGASDRKRRGHFRRASLGEKSRFSVTDPRRLRPLERVWSQKGRKVESYIVVLRRKSESDRLVPKVTRNSSCNEVLRTPTAQQWEKKG